jgi:hypothetical protein
MEGLKGIKESSISESISSPNFWNIFDKENKTKKKEKKLEFNDKLKTLE